MIVGLFTDLLPPGGIQRAGRHTAAVLATFARGRGWPFRFLSLNDPAGMHELQLAGEAFSFRGFARNKTRFVFAVLGLGRLRPRLLVAIHPHLAPVAQALRFFAPGTRCIVVTHGVEVWTPLPPHRRWCLRASDLVLAPSSDTARCLASVQGVQARKVGVLAWGLDPEFAPDPRTKNANLTPSQLPSGHIILTVGRLASADRYKGMDHLIAALPRLLSFNPDVHLVIVGDGPDRSRLEALAAQHLVSARVHFLGALSTSALNACYQRCDVFALPSKGEGFGLVFLEAMAFGKPVVGGAHGGTPDIICDAETGYLVTYGDIDRLVAVLSRLLADPDLRRRIGDAARRRLQSHYLFSQFSAGLRKILDAQCAF